MTQSVNSVLGPIAPEKLGVTLMHEHLVFGYPGWQYDSAAPSYNREKAFEVCCAMVGEAMSHGLKTVVDATPNDGHRDPELYKMVADKTGVNIICSTGLYTEEEGAPAYFKFRRNLTGGSPAITNEVYETFMKDITQGIDGTGVKAGVIKVATGRGEITPYEEMVLEAAAMAQKETGVPIITHTEAGTMGPQQADFLIGQGADSSRLMVGHMCGNADLNYSIEVLKKGVYASYDRFGLNIFMPDTQRTETVIGLIKQGFEKQIMLSQDFICFWLGRELPLMEPLLPMIANWNLTNIFKNIIPTLKNAGITDDQINTIMAENPRRLFSAS
ncbi:MAG: phosphotriesterase family protein [Bacillota bacterium]